ncbi:VanZ family protein [Gorillibacterium massiliense]|uniref:VanZ family protein n=1 Tax=Gorillibacterium massiliense TaxID=1280390 RepID=UPI0004B1E701|nr:VanZ family protein [Gorillibacterium massiliense]
MKKWKHNLLFVMFSIYLYGLAKIILFKLGPVEPQFLLSQLRGAVEHPERIKIGLQLGNLIPFKEISRDLQLNTGSGFLNLWGNIAVFIPLGLFLPIMGAAKKTWWSVLVKSFALSLLLESLQLVLFIGTFDVDDMILNTTGGLLGYVLFSLFVKAANLFGSAAGRLKAKES